MPISKFRISSPLEAGSSLLEAVQLPPQLTEALEYVSERLARKGLHLKLVVVRKDLQMPSVLPSPQSPIQAGTSAALPAGLRSPSGSPTRALFSAAATNITKVLSRHSSRASLDSDTGSTVLKTSGVGVPSQASSRASLSRTKWESLPASPRDGTSAPSSCSSASSSHSSSPELVMEMQCSNPYGITLMHASTLTTKAEKILRHVVGRAEKIYGIGTGYLPSKSPTKSNNPTHDLIQRSLLQNSILFTSTSLTLLALDHLYTFKCYLHTYSRSLSPSDFTIAVDELRRLVLARQYPPHPNSKSTPTFTSIPEDNPKTKEGRSKIKRSELVCTYDWLSVSLTTLVDVDEGYKAAYGGKQRNGAIEVGCGAKNKRIRMPPAPPPIETSFARRNMVVRRVQLRSSICSSVCSGEEHVSGPVSELGCGFGQGFGEVAFGESAKGVELDDDVGRKRGSESGIEVGVGVQIERLNPDRGPHRRGAVTPNRFEDITPVTRGSWCYLMVGEGWKEGRRALVETC